MPEQKAQPKNRKARVAIFNQVDKENYMAPPAAAENAENMPPAGYTQPPYGVRAKAGLLTQVSTQPPYLSYFFSGIKITFLSMFRMRIRNGEYGSGSGSLLIIEVRKNFRKFFIIYIKN